MEHTSIDFIEKYFTQEKTESAFFMFIGLVAICLALINLFIIKYSFYKGLAYPLLIVGFIQLGAGSIVYNRSLKDRVGTEQFYTTNSKKIQTEEILRIETVMTNFVLYKWIEIALIISGIVLFFCCKKQSHVFWKGIGLGLIIQATIILSLNYVAEKRSIIYLKQLQMNSKN